MSARKFKRENKLFWGTVHFRILILSPRLLLIIIMIRKREFEISIILTFVFCFLSCSSLKNIQKAGVVYEDSMNYYVNDSLTFSCKLYGDEHKITDKKMIRKRLREVNKALPFNHCIASFASPIYFPEKRPPSYCHFFYYPKNHTTQNKLLLTLEKDTNDFYIDPDGFTVGKFVSLSNNKGSVYIIRFRHSIDNYCCTLFNQSNTTVFSNIISDEKYRDLYFTPPSDLGTAREISEDSTIKYLTPVIILKRSEPNYYEIRSKWLWLQMYATYLSRLSNEINTTQELMNQWRKGNNRVSIQNALHTNDEALSYLIKRCKDERVVMINENHFTPHHRILGEILVDSLYNYGFRYFGMEALFDTAINERGFATTHTGFYTREPMMANLIRKAIQKEYYVFGYDDTNSDREKDEAANIYQRTIAQDSLAKVLIFAGFGHIDETKWMAHEFFLLTGINPLTIEQEEFVTDEAYFMILDTTNLNNHKNCDIFVANNIDYEFFTTKSGYQNYNIIIPAEIAKQTKKQPLMYVVSIFKTDEYQKDKTAIPVYNHLLKNTDSPHISIKLQTDKYFYAIKDKYGKILYSGNL
jgi:hypothetical protein